MPFGFLYNLACLPFLRSFQQFFWLKVLLKLLRLTIKGIPEPKGKTTAKGLIVHFFPVFD